MLRKGVLTVVVLLAILVLVGCEGPEPTVSPLTPPAPPHAVGIEGGPVVAAQAQQEGDPELTAGIIAAVMAGIISLLLEVVPGLAKKWETVEDTWKRLVFLVGCLVIPLALVGLGCLGLSLGVKPPVCGKDGVVMAIRLGFLAYYISQGTYAMISKALRMRRKRVEAQRRKARGSA
ncbi:MAG TPA: hypothetical protein VMW50_06930 [Dehalococcoidia bacterium]|nr:hypothetical protein [Dehalococcoidia bacterium]